MTRQQSECPWCGAVVTTETRRLDGGAEALAHIRKCPNISRPPVASPDVARADDAPRSGGVGPAQGDVTEATKENTSG